MSEQTQLPRVRTGEFIRLTFQISNSPENNAVVEQLLEQAKTAISEVKKTNHLVLKKELVVIEEAVIYQPQK